MANKTTKHSARIKEEKKVPSTFENLKKNLARLAAEDAAFTPSPLTPEERELLKHTHLKVRPDELFTES